MFLKAYSWLLAGYACIGRSFAAIGAGPIFISELLLAWALIATPFVKGMGRLLCLRITWLFMAFLLLAAGLTVSKIGSFPITDVLRDGAIWGYGIFAVSIACVFVCRLDLLTVSVGRYRRFSEFYTLFGGFIGIIGAYLSSSGFYIPGTTYAPISVRTSEAMVHLAGATAFAYLGFASFSIWRSALVIVALLALGSINRGGFLSAFLGLFVLMTLRPKLQDWVALIGSITLAISIFLFVDVQFSVYGREISSSQIIDNIMSIFGNATGGDLSNTKAWRLQWWGDIIDYTFNGDYFWAGKGFGINLANADGFQVDVEGESLRSPHNSHMTFLARGGVPLFALWVMLQLSWAAAMLRLVFRARARGDVLPERLSIFLLAYWTAMIVNMNFDVYLEGPMGGIWFWTIFGAGLALQWLYKYRPDELRRLESPPPPPN